MCRVAECRVKSRSAIFRNFFCPSTVHFFCPSSAVPIKRRKPRLDNEQSCLLPLASSFAFSTSHILWKGKQGRSLEPSMTVSRPGLRWCIFVLVFVLGDLPIFISMPVNSPCAERWAIDRKIPIIPSHDPALMSIYAIISPIQSMLLHVTDCIIFLARIKYKPNPTA